MSRVTYIVAEVAVMWLFLAIGGGALIWLMRGFDEVGQLFMFGYAIVAFGAAIKMVLIGDSRGLLGGVYRPVRLLAFVLPGIAAFRRESALPVFGLRQTFAFDFRSDRGVSAYDVLDALSATLRSQGIRHSKTGGLFVEDQGATWWLEPDVGADRVKGWVECEERGDRHQIINAIQTFLAHDMRLQVRAA